MSKVIVLNIHFPDELPPPSTKQVYIDHGFSEWYLGKSKSLGGEVCYCTCAYDFHHKKWRILQSGMAKVMEWYTEV